MSDRATSRVPATRATRPRLLAPDFARGSMLLLIALSNTAFFLYQTDYRPGGEYPVPSGPADTVVQFLMVALLDVRTYPLFSFLVGYGIVQSFSGRLAKGDAPAEAARIIRRRNRWLVIFGLLHAALFLGTDVLSSYGLIGMILCAAFLRRSDRRLRGWATAGVMILGVVGLLSVVVLAGAYLLNGAGSAPPTGPAAGRDILSGAGTTNYLVSALQRLIGWVSLLILNGIGVVMPTAIMLGMWAARRRVIEEAADHRALLRRVATGGVALGVLGALPSALATIGVLDPPPAGGLSDLALLGTSWTTGLAGGLGYAACFVLIAERWRSRQHTPVVIGAVAHLGKRSLSGYLSHSIVMAPLLSAWGLGLGAHLTSATMALVAVALWLTTVIAATLLERYGLPGPFESLLRRLSSTRPQDPRDR